MNGRQANQLTLGNTPVVVAEAKRLLQEGETVTVEGLFQDVTEHWT